MKNHRKKQKISAALCLLTLALCLLTGCGGRESGPFTSPEQLNEPGRRIGMADDTGDNRV